MPWVLGLDGGGGRTIALVANEKGKVLGRGERGPATYHTSGIASAADAIRGAALSAIEDAGLVPQALDAAFFALASVDRPTDRQVMAGVTASLGLHCKVSLEHDSAAALAGATNGNPGVVVVADTGSIAYGEDRHGTAARSGGYGPMLGDEGSGYDLGRRAMISALRAEDGRSPATLLTDMIRKRFMLDKMPDLINLVYGNPSPLQRADIASLATLVTTAAQEGDAVARELLRVAGRELGLAAAAVLRQLDWESMETVPVVGCGSVFDAGNLLALPMQQVIQSVTPNAKLMAPQHTPSYGAVLLALRSIGVRLKESPGDR